MRFWRCSAVAAVSMVLAGCPETLGPNISGIPAMGIGSIRVTPEVVTITLPDSTKKASTVVFAALALNRVGVAIKSLPLVWQSSNASVAVVDSSGVATPLRPGTSTISASAGRVGRATLVVFPHR